MILASFVEMKSMSLKRQLLATALLGLAAASASAQVYRIVGPDGKVTFSDKPPETAGKSGASPAAGQAAAAGGGGNPALPFTLRQVTERFPVTLYTSSNCAPCAAARSLLSGRGVPFTEKTITTNEDIAALERISGSATLPFGTIGGQQLRGFAAGEWTQFLDAAGYPKSSQLPNGYRQAAASPLVAVQETARAPAPAPAPQAAPALPPPPAPAPAGDNPAGIRF